MIYKNEHAALFEHTTINNINIPTIHVCSKRTKDIHCTYERLVNAIIKIKELFNLAVNFATIKGSIVTLFLDRILHKNELVDFLNEVDIFQEVTEIMSERVTLKFKND